MKVKNSRYDFRVNKDTKEKFKVYCKIMNVSPSDVLSEVLEEFNSNAEKIIKMQDINELRSLLREKMDYASNEIQHMEQQRAIEK